MEFSVEIKGNEVASKKTKRMMASVDTLSGSDDCTDAVPALEAPSWLLPLMVLLGAFAGVMASRGVWWASLIALLLALVAYYSVSTFWIIASKSDGVVLARSSKMSSGKKAVEIVGQYPTPVDASVDKKSVVSYVKLDGHIMSVFFSDAKRLDAILD